MSECMTPTNGKDFAMSRRMPTSRLIEELSVPEDLSAEVVPKDISRIGEKPAHFEDAVVIRRHNTEVAVRAIVTSCSGTEKVHLSHP